MKANKSTSCSKKNRNKNNLDSDHTAEHIEKAQKRAKKHSQKKCETEHEKSLADSTFTSTKHDINNKKVSNGDSSSNKKRKSKHNFDSENVTKRTKKVNPAPFPMNEIKSEISSNESDCNSTKHDDNKNIEKETHTHFRKKDETEYEKSSVDSTFTSKKCDINNKKVPNDNLSSDKKRKSKHNFDSENVTKRTKKVNPAPFPMNEIKSEISSNDSDCNSIKHDDNKNIEKETHTHFRKKDETEYEKSSVNSTFASKKHDSNNKKVSNGDSSSNKKRKSKHNFDSENVTKRTKKVNSAPFPMNEIKSEISSDDSDCNSIKHDDNKNIEKETHTHFRKKDETEYEKSSVNSTFASKKHDSNNKKVSNGDPSSDKKRKSKNDFDSVTKHTKNENSVDFLKNKITSEISSDDSDCNSINQDDNKNISNNDLENELELLITSKQENPPKIRDEKFFKKLRKIDIDWILPVLHKMATQVVRLPEPDVREQIKKLEIPWKRGYFSPDEDKIIKNNWDNLRETYLLPDTPEVLAHFRNVENNSALRKIRRMAILWLARDLPERTPAQVFQRFVHKFGASKKGRFSDKDLKILESYASKVNGPFTQQSLGAILGRDERSIYRRLKVIEREDSTKIKIKWSLKLCEKFLQNLLLVIGKNTKSTATLKTLRDYKITWNDWLEVGKILELQPLKLKTYWYCKLYVQLFTTHPIYTKDILIKLFSTLKKRQYQHLHEVDWSDIATKFKYVTPMFLWKRFYVFAYSHTPRVKEEFKSLVETFYIDYVVNKKKIRNLRLLQYELSTENKLTIKDRW